MNADTAPAADINAGTQGLLWPASLAGVGPYLSCPFIYRVHAVVEFNLI